MKSILLTSIAAILAISLNAQQTGTFKDSRDGKTYKTVKIGTQTWMAENLAFKPTSGNYWAYENDQNNVAKYGYLYDWATAKNICPAGWHLSSEQEWEVLDAFMVLKKFSMYSLRAKSGWLEDYNGSDSLNFTALPSGARNNSHGGHIKEFAGIGSTSSFWNSNEIDPSSAMTRLSYENVDYYRYDGFKVDGNSVRCIKNK